MTDDATIERGDYVTIGNALLVWKVETARPPTRPGHPFWYVLSSGQSARTRRGYIENVRLHSKGLK